jgi:2-keto-3-deoxy-L-rhamnonate aldolase RhmA
MLSLGARGAGLQFAWPLNPKGELLLVAMIEPEEGARHAQEIVGTPGLSAVHVVHLPEADNVRVVGLCKAHGVVAAIDVTPEDVAKRVAEGYRLLSLGWDFGLMQKALADTLKSTRAQIK